MPRTSPRISHIDWAILTAGSNLVTMVTCHVRGAPVCHQSIVAMFRGPSAGRCVQGVTQDESYMALSPTPTHLTLLALCLTPYYHTTGRSRRHVTNTLRLMRMTVRAECQRFTSVTLPCHTAFPEHRINYRIHTLQIGFHGNSMILVRSIISISITAVVGVFVFSIKYESTVEFQSPQTCCYRDCTGRACCLFLVTMTFSDRALWDRVGACGEIL